MGAAGQELRRQQRVVAHFPLLAEDRLRLPALAIDADAPLSGTGEKFFQRQADRCGRCAARSRFDQGDIFFSLLAQRGVQLRQRHAAVSLPLKKFLTRSGERRVSVDREGRESQTVFRKRGKCATTRCCRRSS